MSTYPSPSVCLYFQVHQPYRLRDLRISDIGNLKSPFDEEKNEAIFRKVAQKCYLPANNHILEMLREHPEFRVAYSLSGVFLDQCEQYGHDVLESFKQLASTGQVEFLAETYYHSLSGITSLKEFCEQVQKHIAKIQQLFGQVPTIFRNTELIFNNEIAHVARLMGFSGIIAEGVDRNLHGSTPTIPHVPPHFRLPLSKERLIAAYRPHATRSKDITILLKHYHLSDDIAFRFSSNAHNGTPLYAETFAKWIKDTGGHSINLFMDYETFGEHQWEDTGIFNFLRALPNSFKNEGIQTLHPSTVIDEWKKKTKNQTPVYDAHHLTSWADTERDLSAWRGNQIQNAALSAVYALEEAVKTTQDQNLIEQWRKLQTSDHFYYMCTKYWSDGDVHKYFSPYDSPYEAYRRYSHAIQDLKTKIENYNFQNADNKHVLIPEKHQPMVKKCL